MQVYPTQENDQMGQGSPRKNNQNKKIQECSLWVQANATIDMVATTSKKVKILSYQLAF